ncbi:hypothetical protein [Sphingosinicella humi]|uniref:Uncharacterized protein n=1 Tax=Allosphingosinicella humi TaxID=2068657 RepID=A0A2U2J4N2_9SPHN|nr:hypothetical protein [Sphingosinicella humi]PWG03306.1 hypothetical protein DF286_10830 [Sphingosinicella humi]
MATFVFYADEPHKRRADGRNTLVAAGATEAAARAVAEALIRQPGALEAFAAVELGDSVPAFVVEGFGPVGSRGQSVWPGRTRGGDSLPGN